MSVEAVGAPNVFRVRGEGGQDEHNARRGSIPTSLVRTSMKNTHTAVVGLKIAGGKKPLSTGEF